MLLKVAHADGDLHGDAWAAVWHADSALASTEAPGGLTEEERAWLEDFIESPPTNDDTRIASSILACPAPVGERVPEGWRVEWIDRWVTPAERRHVPILVPDTPHEGGEG